LRRGRRSSFTVMPAKAGIQCIRWIPAYAGMTDKTVRLAERATFTRTC
jgi:hypothetical protein